MFRWRRIDGAASRCRGRGRTLSERRFLYSSETRTMCGPLFLTVASICLLSVGTCLGFLTAALFATSAEPAQVVEAKMAASIPDETAEAIWQAAESLYILASCLREGEDSFGPMADAAR